MHHLMRGFDALHQKFQLSVISGFYRKLINSSPTSCLSMYKKAFNLNSYTLSSSCPLPLLQLILHEVHFSFFFIVFARFVCFTCLSFLAFSSSTQI